MNITTLEQASKHLIDCGAVAFELGQFSVEGKQLLEISGFKNTSTPTTQLRQIIAKHAFKEDFDFLISLSESNGGRPSTIYHFSLNAANHILLAAMTDQGKAARQDAINTKTSQTNPALPPELASDPVIVVRMAQIEQQRQLDEHQAQIADVTNQVQQMTTGAPIGWAILTRIGEMYGFSKMKAKAIAQAYELEQKPISVGEYGAITRMVKVEDFKDALSKEMKAATLNGAWFKSTKLGRYSAKGLFLKQYTEKVLRVPFDSLV